MFFQNYSECINLRMHVPKTFVIAFPGIWFPISVTSHERNDVSNYRLFDCLFNNMFNPTSKKTSLALCEGNPPVTGGFSSQWTNNVESVSKSWRLPLPCVNTKARVGNIGISSGQIWNHTFFRGEGTKPTHTHTPYHIQKVGSWRVN